MKRLIVWIGLVSGALAAAQTPATAPASQSTSPTDDAAAAAAAGEGSMEGEPSDQQLAVPSDSSMVNDLSAPGGVDDARFRDVAKELRCPTCTGLSVLESEASFSVQIKDQVREQMQLGKNKEQILNFFTDRYGPWILREPPAKGFSLLAWLVPIALLCLGPLVIWFTVWKRRVHISTHGVRGNEPIIAEMQERLQQLKLKQGKGGV